MIIDRCLNCGLCVSVCPNNCISFAYAGFDGYVEFKNAVLDEYCCICCCSCSEICPVRAIDLGVRCGCPFGGGSNGDDDSGGGDSDGGDWGDNSEEEIRKKNQEIICVIFTGTIDPKSLKENYEYFTPQQEQFVINLANIAAMNTLLSSSLFAGLQSDLTNYDESSSLYSKYSRLNNHKLYTQGWEEVYNSSPNSDKALLSPEIIDSNYQLKFYPEKNGESNALGLIKEGVVDHGIEAALEFIEGYMRDNHDSQDDFLTDMHFFNALNFMEVYCNV